MRRAAVAGLATAVALCVVGVADAKKQRLKVHTEVAIEGLRYDFGTDTVTLFGQVHAGRPKCDRNRHVELVQVTDDLFAGSDRSEASGQWEVAFGGTEIDPGYFQATAKKRKIVKRKRIIRCREGVSAPFFGTTFP
jgi:hypothetical protein